MPTGDLLSKLQQFLGGQTSAQGNQAIQDQLAKQAAQLQSQSSQPRFPGFQAFQTPQMAPSEEPPANVVAINGQPVDEIEGTYTVQPGDTLWDISQRFLGSGTRFNEIAKLNNIPNPDLIIPGMKLQIPTGSPQLTKASDLPERNPVRS